MTTRLRCLASDCIKYTNYSDYTECSGYTVYRHQLHRLGWLHRLQWLCRQHRLNRRHRLHRQHRLHQLHWLYWLHWRHRLHTCPILSTRFQWTKRGVRRSLVEKWNQKNSRLLVHLSYRKFSHKMKPEV